MASLGFAGMSSMLGSLMQNGGSPPLTPHPLALGHSPASLHAHHAQHSHPVLGLWPSEPEEDLENWSSHLWKNTVWNCKIVIENFFFILIINEFRFKIE